MADQLRKDSGLDPHFRPQTVAVIAAPTSPLEGNVAFLSQSGALAQASDIALDRIEEAMLRLSQLIADFDTIEELDINPFFASERPEECKAADARIRVAP